MVGTHHKVHGVAKKMKQKPPKRQTKKTAQTASQVTVPPLPSEERRAEVATVVWMLTALFTSAAETLGLVVRLFFAFNPEPASPESIAPLALLPGIALFGGLITGAICLVLTPVVYRLRRTPPPIMVTIFAVLVSLLPPATLLLRFWRN